MENDFIEIWYRSFVNMSSLFKEHEHSFQDIALELVWIIEFCWAVHFYQHFILFVFTKFREIAIHDYAILQVLIHNVGEGVWVFVIWLRVFQTFRNGLFTIWRNTHTFVWYNQGTRFVLEDELNKFFVLVGKYFDCVVGYVGGLWRGLMKVWFGNLFNEGW